MPISNTTKRCTCGNQKREFNEHCAQCAAWRMSALGAGSMTGNAIAPDPEIEPTVTRIRVSRRGITWTIAAFMTIAGFALGFTLFQMLRKQDIGPYMQVLSTDGNTGWYVDTIGDVYDRSGKRLPRADNYRTDTLKLTRIKNSNAPCFVLEFLQEKGRAPVVACSNITEVKSDENQK